MAAKSASARFGSGSRLWWSFSVTTVESSAASTSAQLRAHEQAFRERGANLAAIGLGDASYARQFREDTGIAFPLLIDEERLAYRAAGLRNANLLHMLRSENKIVRARARSVGHRQHKLGQNPFQLGGSFVFGPGNVDQYSHVSRTFGDNAPVEDLLAVL